MPTLAGFNGASLVPDLGPAINQLVGLIGTRQQRDERAAEEARQAEEQRLFNEATALDVPAGEGGLPANFSKKKREAALRLTGINQSLGLATLDILNSRDERAKEQFIQEAEIGAKNAAFITSQPDFISKQKAITSLAEEALRQGRPIDTFIRWQNLDEGDLGLEMQRVAIAGQDVKTVLAGETVENREVQSAKILPGGTVQVVFKDGTTEVIPGTPENIAIVRAAEDRGTTLAIERAGGKATAVAQTRADIAIETGAEVAGVTAASKAAIKKSTEFFDQLAPLDKSTLNIEKAIAELDAGAKTGPIAQFFPSIKAASVKLDNLQKQLGLDVVSSVTFGALSKGELDIALSTGLPTGLNETELRRWLVDKKDAQLKLRSYLEDAATFLGTPGNTIAGFIEQQKAGQAASQLPAGVTEDDIQTTMEANNMTREQVLQRLGVQ